MGRLWQAAGTVKSVFQPGLLEKAADAGLRSLFVGFETVNAAIRRLHSLGIMVNGSFVFGMDSDDSGVFDRTVEWAIEQGIETATFHILTPIRALASISEWPRRIACCTPTGTATAPGMLSSGPPA
jgi:hypothetical protein